MGLRQGHPDDVDGPAEGGEPEVRERRVRRGHRLRCQDLFDQEGLAAEVEVDASDRLVPVVVARRDEERVGAGSPVHGPREELDLEASVRGDGRAHGVDGLPPAPVVRVRPGLEQVEVRRGHRVVPATDGDHVVRPDLAGVVPGGGAAVLVDEHVEPVEGRGVGVPEGDSADLDREGHVPVALLPHGVPAEGDVRVRRAHRVVEERNPVPVPEVPVDGDAGRRCGRRRGRQEVERA